MSEHVTSPDPTEQRATFAERLRTAGVSTQRFIDVHDESKGTTNHTQRGPDADALRGNYGVYGGPGADEDVTEGTRWLVDVDVDDYADADASTSGLDSLPETFTIESPHTDGETGGHRYYAVAGDVATAFEERVDVKNPSPGWGEVRVSNQYCVGPGSQISPGGCVHDWCDPDDGGCTGCDKDWCDECAKPDGGYYRIADDREIAVLELDTFTEAIIADLPDSCDQSSGSADSGEWNASTSVDAGGYTPDPDADTKAVIRANTWIADYLIGVDPDADRSRKDFAVCRAFAKAGVAEEDARDVLNGSNHTKAAERGDDYWASTWNRAVADAQPTDATEDVGRSESTASTDGGTTVAGRSDANETAGTDANDGPTAGLSWNAVRELFRSSEKGTSGEATQAAAMRLLDEFDLVTVEENDNIWRYSPETGTFSDDGVARLRKRLADGLNFTYSRSRVTDILHRVRSETYVKRDSLGAPENMVCVADGVLDLTDPEDPELLPHSPEYRFTWGVNAPYDPDAEAPMFRQFIGESIRPEDITKLQEYAGDALRHWEQPRNLCVLLGPTDAGKGVFMRVLRATFGDDNVASETLGELTDTRWGAHSLLNRPINLANELSTGQLERPERAKNFSGGGDTISAEDKGESKFEMTPTANHLFATNGVPQVSNADPAFYNRWLFVTFPTSVPTDEQDDTLDTRMIESDEERAGILNWLIEGYARRQSRTGTGFDGERTIAEKEDMWSAYGTSIERFVATCISTDDATDDDSIAKKDAYAVYKVMCNAVGISVESQQKLTTELKKEEGVGDGKRKVDAHFDDALRARVFTGVRWADDGEMYLDRALNARRSSEAKANTHAQQTGLDDTRNEITQQQSVRALLETIDDLTDEGRGEPVAIETVVDAAVHTDERARHLLRNLINQGTIREDPDGHVLPN